jgi:hypothetical protein
MQRLHEQFANVLLERHVANNANELIEVEDVINAAKVMLANGGCIVTITIVVVDFFGAGLLLMLLRMVDGFIGKICIFWFFSS